MKKKLRAAASCLAAAVMLSWAPMIGLQAQAMDPGLLEASDVTVTLDGSGGTAAVPLVGTGPQNIYGLEGSWDLTEQEGGGYVQLQEITSEILTFTGFDYVDTQTGKVLWMDDTFSAPGVLNDGVELLCANYTIAPDTPAGTYTVRFRCDVIAGSDYEANEDVRLYTATITVKGGGNGQTQNPGGSGSTQNPGGSQPDPVGPSGIAFTDVSREAYYYQPVAWAVAEGITAGTTAATFSPQTACTRAQAVVFLWRAAGSPAPVGSEMPFTDVAAGTYYHDAVLWAVENGITSGTTATTFSPDRTCTRGQIVTFLWRAQGNPSAGERNPFADVAAEAYYYRPVLWAVENGITSGTSDSTFSPDNSCTRAQIVTFLYRNHNR